MCDARLDSARFANDAAEEFVNGAVVERAGVEVLQTVQDVALAVRVAKRQSGRLFKRADFQCETRSHVQQTQQFGVDLVDLFAPMLDVHHGCSGF